MSLPVLIGFAGVLVAVAATGVLAGRCVRQPRIDFIVWTVATLGLTIALAAQSMGFESGFGSVTFRAVQLFALLLAPLWLAWGLVELAVPNEAARFGMRLVAGALTVVASVILSTDPLTAQPFSKAWPLTGPHFQPISHYALDVVQAAAVAAVAVSAAMAAVRARNDPSWRPAMAAVVLVGLVALMMIGLRFPFPATAAYPLLSMLAAALVWFGVSRVPELPGRAARRGGFRDGRRDGLRDGSGRYRPGDRPDDDYWPDGRYGPADDRVPEGQYAVYGSGGDPGRRVNSRPQPRAPERHDRYRGSGPGGPGVDDRLPGTQAVHPLGTEAAARAGSGAAFGSQASAAGSPAAAPARPYGRIQIFTLLDDRVADFDRLAEQTAEEVSTGEPDTLVYVIHLVPNAPLQRIFYEIYRDRAAFDSHESQPYVQRFVAERRASVLATNVIELRLKYAKVAPLPTPQAPAPAASAPVPSLTAPSPGARPRLPAGPPPRPQPLPAAGARGPQGASGPHGVPGSQGTQRPQPLPPARSQRPDPQRPDPQRPDAQRPDQRWPDQRQVPSAGRRY
jgi:quinol monooxygenase YgiN